MIMTDEISAFETTDYFAIESRRRQKSVLFRYDRGVKRRSCSNEIGASKGGLAQMRWGRQKAVLYGNGLNNLNQIC